MNRTGILEALDTEIARLQQVRALLADSLDFVPETARRGPGRPKGSANAKPKAATPPAKRKLSPEGRARIAAAQKKRWAALHNATANKKVATKRQTAKKSSVKSAKKVAKKRPAKGVGRPSAAVTT